MDDLLVTIACTRTYALPAIPDKTTKMAGHAMAHFGRSWPRDPTVLSTAR
jgi:hypothetical protein